MAFKTIADRILVRQAPAETKLSSGFIIPENVADKKYQGTVLDKGPGRITKTGTLIPISVEIGDEIMFEPGGITVNVDGEDLLVLKEDAIIGVLNK